MRITTLATLTVGLIGATSANAQLLAGWDFSDLAGDGTVLPAAYGATHLDLASAGTLSFTQGGPGVATNFGGGLACAETGVVGNTDMETFPPPASTFGGPIALGLTTNGTGLQTMQLAYTIPPGVLPAILRISGGVTSIPGPALPSPIEVQVSLTDCVGSADYLGRVWVDTMERPIDFIRFFTGAPAGSGCVEFEWDADEADLVFDNLAVTAGLLGAVFSDSDADLVPDGWDNCTTIANGPLDSSNQIDTDRDGYGNACDADYPFEPFSGGDLLVTTADFGPFIASFMGTDPNQVMDHNGDCITTTQDFGLYLGQFQGTIPIGPGLACAGITWPCTADIGSLEFCDAWTYDPALVCEEDLGPF